MQEVFDITISMVEVADASELIAYFDQVTYESNFMIRNPGESVATLEEEEASIRKIHEQPRQALWKATHQGEIIGAIGLYPFELQRLRHRAGLGLSVKKAYWGKHVASRMMEVVLAYAQTNEITSVELEVSLKNQAGIALYKKYGFQIFGEYKNFMKIDGKYVRAYYMYKDI